MMGTARIDNLRSVPLFAGLGDGSLTRVLDLATEIEVPAGYVLVEARREGSGLFIIEEGTAVVDTKAGPVELGPGKFVGELALLSPQAVRTARVHAKTPLRALAISRADFLKIIEQEPKIAIRLLETLADRLTAQG